MTAEQVESIIKFGITVFGAGGTVTTIAWKYISFLEVKARENSYGPAKVKEFEDAVEEFKIKINGLIEKVESLGRNYTELIKQITENYLGGRNK